MRMRTKSGERALFDMWGSESNKNKRIKEKETKEEDERESNCKE